MDAFAQFMYTPIFGLPIVIWIIFWKSYSIGYFPLLLWGAYFNKYIWNPDYMKEVLGEELYNKLS